MSVIGGDELHLPVVQYRPICPDNPAHADEEPPHALAWLLALFCAFCCALAWGGGIGMVR